MTTSSAFNTAIRVSSFVAGLIAAGTPDLGADARGDAGVLGLRADSPAVRPGAQNGPGPVFNEAFVDDLSGDHLYRTKRE